jgi:DNA-binding NarL/FixJ family response regulator
LHEDTSVSNREAATLDPAAPELLAEMRTLISTMERLIDAIRVARVERDQAQRVLMDALASALGEGRKRATLTGITPSELRAMRIYAKTGSMRKAAEELQIAEQTVKNHLASVRRRLGATNTAQALVMLGLPSEHPAPDEGGTGRRRRKTGP